jgi:hypothetical protein
VIWNTLKTLWWKAQGDCKWSLTSLITVGDKRYLLVCHLSKTAWRKE